MRTYLLLSLCALVAACSSSTTAGGGSDFASRMCAKVSSCSFTINNCQGVFSAVVLSSACQDTFLNASCADLAASPTPASLQGCIPSCSGTMTCKGSTANVTSATCNGDGTFTECTNGSQFTYTCDGICAAESKKYTGTCGLTYSGQNSPSGCPACWCQ